MLRLVDVLIRDLLIDEVALLTTDTQVRFQPPDPAWRTAVVGLNRMAVSVYLADLRTNRKLHSNARDVTVEFGMAFSERAPERVDCHYLLSAWSPTPVGGMIEPTLDEHQLLYDVIAALEHRAPLTASDVYPAGSAKLNAWPERFQDHQLPTQVLPAEGFLKLAEFWSGMGDVRWRPSAYLIVTVPVALVRDQAGPMVTTRITEYRTSKHPESAETWIQICGSVLDTGHPLPDGTPAPVIGAWVRLETVAGDVVQSTSTGDLGRFSFGWLRGGQYRLHAGDVALGEKSRQVTVPTETGEYDVLYP